ncbi:type IX secretion system periplasmic lipoprotein PorW/SprE [Flavobacterium cellulosilyticum]|uniref:type IX secretion system periplasmic lipoprotein PorW/SprE n=1 Tax=Flavobacterium cellulosilyticum TaxID=2541731 RepID=UPI001FEACA3D|nr:gliding motility protein [Flavobacterium cellulosilyticum]
MINSFPLKTKTLTSFFAIVFLIIVAACSTHKDTFLARKSHALSTKYNIDYNGQIALEKGIEDIKLNTKDNFWKILPIERMQISDDADIKNKNTNFELAEAKATKAIQKHSMNINGSEKNSQMDEAYLLLGKARYYDQRFIPALDAFNYILYKYSNSDKIYQAKIWREKTNMRLGNDVQVIKNISKLLDDKRIKKQNSADANALLAESFLNLEEKDSAISKLKIAEIFTKVNSEKARYRFILGQLYQELGKKDSANIFYQSVIDMNRKAERLFTIQAYAKKAQLFDYEKGDKMSFVKTFEKLAADRENRPFLGVIYYEMGVFYDKTNDQKLASKFYNASLKKASSDPYLVASNYRNIGNMHFKNTDYAVAAKYYDSTLVKLQVKTREYIHINKVRKDLDEVIEYESIAKINDSILNVVGMSDENRVLYFENYIEKLKKEDEKKKILEEKQKQILENIVRNNLTSSDDPAAIVQKAGMPPKKQSLAPPSINVVSGNVTANTFYFYNPATVAYGKSEFKKRWGKRTLGSNWRLSTTSADAVEEVVTNNINETTSEEKVEEKVVEKETPEQYTSEFYIKQLPKTQLEVDEIAKERNLAYYQLGIIYKEKFKEYELASNKLEKLLVQNPEQKLVLPSMYNLYKIYQITDIAKAEDMKQRISSQYPDSRYALIINNTDPKTESIETTEAVYNKWYQLYQDEQFRLVLEKIDTLIIDFTGDEIAPKFELLKANTIGKLRGLEDYKKAMQFVLDNYPISDEGRNAQEILTTQIPLLEKRVFTMTDTKKWKILYKIDVNDSKNTKVLEEKIKKLIASENVGLLTYSIDVYSEKENLVVLQGLKSENEAKNISYVLQDEKKYKISEPAIVITNENYSVVQIKKNLEEYLTMSKTAVVPVQTEVKQPLNPKPADQISKKPLRTKPSSGYQQSLEENQNPNSPPK